MLLTRYAICMSFGLIYRPRRTLKRRELHERCLKLTVSLLKSRFESEMHTASRRERRFVQKVSTPRRREHGGTSAAGMPGSGGAPQTLFFIGKRENAHRAQARAHFSKCAPRAGESSILLTQDGAHDHVCKQNEHRAEAGAPFSRKRCTARRREAQKCSSGAAKVLPLQRRAPYKSDVGPA